MFGTNEQVGRKFFGQCPEYVAGALLITSIFYTLQGEGRYAGYPAVFIRTTKCNLACSFCLPAYLAAECIAAGETLPKMVRLGHIGAGDRIMDYDKFGNRVWTTVVSNQALDVPVSDMRVLGIRRSNTSGLRHLLVHKDHQIQLKDGTWWTATDPLTKVVANDVVGDGAKIVARSVADESKQAVRSLRLNEIHNGSTYGMAQPDTIRIAAIKTESGHYASQDLLHHNCDTFFDEGQWMTVEQIVERVKSIVPDGVEPIIVITGGEPLLQAQNLVPLVRALRDDHLVTFETTGSLPPLAIENGTDLHYTVSPKVVGTSHMKVHPAWLKGDTFFDFKFVVSSTDTRYADVPQWHAQAVATLKNCYGFGASVRTYISPMNCYKQGVHQIKVLDSRLKGEVDGPVLSQWDTTGPLDLDANRKNHSYAAALCKAHGYNLSLQTHLFTELP